MTVHNANVVHLCEENAQVKGGRRIIVRCDVRLERYLAVMQL